MSLMDMVKGHLTQAVLGQLGGALGESADKTTAGVNAAVPTILDGIIRKASTGDGANWLGKELDNHDGGVLNNIGGLLDPSKSKGAADKGLGLLGSLMGDGMLGNVAGLISKVSGLGSGSSRSMLGILMPIVLGVLGKHRKSSGMDMGGLVGFLNEQKSSVSSALPAGLSDLYQGATSAAGSTASRATSSASTSARSAHQAPVTSSGGGGGLGKLLPLFLIPIVGFLAWKFWPPGAVKAAGEGAGAVAEGVGGAAGTVSGGVGALGDGASGISFDWNKPEAVVSGLPGLMDGAKSTFEGINDVESAKAALPKIEGLSSTFEGLGKNLGSMPKVAQGTIKEKVGGFIPTIQGMVDTVLKIPGVEAVLGPTLKGLLEKLAVFG